MYFSQQAMCFFSRQNTWEKLKEKNVVSVHFLSRHGVNGARFAETSFGRAGSQPDHATRYRRGGLMPENGRFSPAPRMARAG